MLWRIIDISKQTKIAELTAYAVLLNYITKPYPCVRDTVWENKSRMSSV